MTSNAGERPLFAQNHNLPTDQFSSLADAIAHYLDTVGLDYAPPYFGASICAPVTGDIIEMYNPNWSIHKQDIIFRFGFKDAFFGNDNSTIASALPWLEAEDVLAIGGKNPQLDFSNPEGRYCVIDSSAGLGLASLRMTNNGRFHCVDSEGGHATFAPSSDREISLLSLLRDRFDHVSNETILSTDGLFNIYSALCALRGERNGNLTPLEIMLYGRTEADKICTEALEVYFDGLASVAGNTALTTCSVDGVFLSGYVPVNIIDCLDHDRFMKIFKARGRFTDFVSDIPVYLITNPSSRLIGLACAMCDRINRMENAESDLAKPEDLLHEITTTIDQSIMIIDEDLKILANSEQTWYDLPTDTDAPVRGGSLEDYICGLAASGQLSIGSDKFDNLRRGNDAADEILHQFSLRNDFTFERTKFGGRIFSVVAKNRTKGGYVLVETDVTEQRDRTSELEALTANLRESKVKSDAASRSKSEFLANMSHEIRTPLNGVLGMADILSRTKLDNDQASMLDVVISSGNSLLTVINDILDFSKMEAGKMRLQRAPFNLHKCIEDVATMFAPQVERKNLELLVRIRPGTPSALIGDIGRVRQALTNIVGNAVKFTETGHILIDVLGKEENGRADIRIDVTDTGCGIPDNKIKSVFGMFEQVDGSSTRHHEGTGLGLSITRRLVELMGGGVSARSEVGVGSTFTIEVPLPIDQEGHAHVQIDHHQVSLAGARILIVDDLSVNRQILAEQMRAWEMEPLLAASPSEALQILSDHAAQNKTIDAAVLDFQMPDMDGLMLSKKMREVEGFEKLPQILLTSVGHVSDSESFASYNFSGYLVKPARVGQLLDEIAKALAPSRAVGTAPHAAHEPKAQGATDNAQGANTPDVQSSSDDQISQQTAEQGTELAQDAQATTLPAPQTQITTTLEPKAFTAKVDDNIQPAENIVASETPPHTDKHGFCVLLAEDNPVNRMVVTNMLKDAKVDIRTATDGKLAVEEFEKKTPDMILMDVSMPMLDGYAATKAIRRLERERDTKNPVPIIGVTAHALPEDREKCLENGMDGYLPKPISRDDLLAIIDQHIKKTQAA